MCLTSCFYDAIYSPKLTKNALKQPFNMFIKYFLYLDNITISPISKLAGVWLFLCNTELW